MPKKKAVLPRKSRLGRELKASIKEAIAYEQGKVVLKAPVIESATPPAARRAKAAKRMRRPKSKFADKLKKAIKQAIAHKQGKLKLKGLPPEFLPLPKKPKSRRPKSSGDTPPSTAP